MDDHIIRKMDDHRKHSQYITVSRFLRKMDDNKIRKMDDHGKRS